MCTKPLSNLEKDCPLNWTERQSFMVQNPERSRRQRVFLKRNWPGREELRLAKFNLDQLRFQRGDLDDIRDARRERNAIRNDWRQYWHRRLAEWIDERIDVDGVDYGPNINIGEVIEGQAVRRSRDEKRRKSGILRTAEEINADTRARLIAEGVMTEGETLAEVSKNLYERRMAAQQRKIDATAAQARAESQERADDRQALLRRVSEWVATANPVIRDMYNSDFSSEEQEWVHLHFDETPVGNRAALVYDARGKTRDDLDKAWEVQEGRD